MRILQIVHSLPFLNQAGVEVYTYNLCRELAKRNQVFIFTRISDARKEEYGVIENRIGNLTVYSINNTFRHCSSLSEYYDNDSINIKFEELLKEVSPDVVHIQHLVFLSTGIMKIIEKNNIPIVFTLHDYWLICPKWHLLKSDWSVCKKAADSAYDSECFDCLSGIINISKKTAKFYYLTKNILPGFLIPGLRKIYFSVSRRFSDKNDHVDMLKERIQKIKSCLRYVNIFLAPSEYLRKKFIEFGIPAEKIELSRNGLNISLFAHPQDKKSSGKIRFGFIGTILPGKGLHILIKAFNQIKNNNLELLIYGALRSYAGYEDYLVNLRKIAKSKNIKFMGEFDNEKVPDIFSNFDVLIIPSIWPENNPLVIQEAFLAKTPVIASRVGGISELIKEGVNGLLFDPYDPKDLRKKIEYLISNLEITKGFEVNMPKVKSIGDNAKEIEEIYKKIIAGKNAHILDIKI